MKSKTRQTLIQIGGWYGVVAILLAYGLVSFGALPPSGFLFQGLNISGSVGILIEALSRNDKQPVVLNAIWIVVGILALARLFLH